MKTIVLAAALLVAAAPLAARELKSVAVTPVLSTTVTASGQPIVLPTKDAQVLVSIFRIAPGATLPVHKHPYPRYAYVLAGTLRVTDTESGTSRIYRTGDFIVETIGQWHQGSAVGQEPVKLLVIDQVEKGQSNTILHQ